MISGRFQPFHKTHSYHYHTFAKIRWKSLKFHHFINLKIHKFWQNTKTYIVYFFMEMTAIVYCDKQSSQGTIDFKTSNLYINQVLTSLNLLHVDAKNTISSYLHHCQHSFHENHKTTWFRVLPTCQIVMSFMMLLGI